MSQRSLDALRLVAPALLAALVVTQALSSAGSQSIDPDGRLVGLAAAIAALAIGAGLFVAVAVAVGLTVVCRLVL